MQAPLKSGVAAPRLSLKGLEALPDSVARPGYARSDLTAGILHIGVGNFHRAHQAVYLDRLFNTGHDHDWALIGAGVRAADAQMRADLEAQDWLSTVVELDPAGYSARVAGAMIDFLEVTPGTSTALIERLLDPAIRIVSLTVTEGGYYMDAAGGFDATHADILADLAAPEAPNTVFGILIRALLTRRAAGTPAFTVMSCDNLPQNGHVCRSAMAGLAAVLAPADADWIENHVAYPDSMVDCITPATTDRERNMVADRFGIRDARPVICEPFRDWILQDHFTAGRPALEEVGVTFVPDVAPYELMKLRILNGGHAAIGYPGALLGHHFVHDAATDPDILGFLDALQRREVIPLLEPIQNVSYAHYLDQVKTRFANPEVGDTTSRLALDGSNRQPKFILPSVVDALVADLPLDGLALEVALWCRYCAGVAEDGTGIELVDERAEILSDRAEASRTDPCAFLEISDVFGGIATEPRFRAAFSEQITRLWSDGVRATLARYAAG